MNEALERVKVRLRDHINAIKKDVEYCSTEREKATKRGQTDEASYYYGRVCGANNAINHVECVDDFIDEELNPKPCSHCGR